MRYPTFFVIVLFVLSVCSVEADPVPVGSSTMPLQGGPQRPTAKWQKAQRSITAQTNGTHKSKLNLSAAGADKPVNNIRHMRTKTTRVANSK